MGLSPFFRALLGARLLDREALCHRPGGGLPCGPALPARGRAALAEAPAIAQPAGAGGRHLRLGRSLRHHGWVAQNT